MSEIITMPPMVYANNWPWKLRSVVPLANGEVHAMYQRIATLSSFAQPTVTVGFGPDEVEAGEVYLRTLAQWIIEAEVAKQ